MKTCFYCCSYKIFQQLNIDGEPLNLYNHKGIKKESSTYLYPEKNSSTAINPENFFNLLKENKIHIKKKIIFPDHFNYKISDIKKIKQYANENNLKVITSEKDYTKIKHFKNMNIKFTKVDLYINRNLIFEKFLLNNL